METIELRKKSYPDICSNKGCWNKASGVLCGTCRSRKSRLADPVKYAYHNIKNRAKQRGKVFTLTLEYFRKFCIKTEYIAGKNRSAEGYTVDRIRNEDGYTDDNIQMLIKKDNIKKYLNFDWQHRIATVTEFPPMKEEDKIF